MILFEETDLLLAGALYCLGYLFILNSLFYIWRWRDLKSLTLGCAILTFGLVSLYSALVKSGHILELPFLFGIDLIITNFGMIPIVLFTLIVLNSDFKWKPLYWPVMLYPILQAAIFIVKSPDTEAARLAFVQNVIKTGGTTYFANDLSYFMILAANTIAGLIIGRSMLKNFRWRQVPQNYRNKVLTTAILFYSMLFFVCFFQIKLYIMAYSGGGLSPGELMFYYSTVFIWYLYVQLWPYIFKYGRIYFDIRTFKIERNPSVNLEKVDLSMIENKLSDLMQRDKLFLDEDLKSNSVAELLGISVHQFSTFLNQHLSQNFSEYINTLRINEAKKLLSVENNKFTVLDICYQVGFNSPSVFYTAFKKITGKSPKVWLKKYRSGQL